MNTKKTYICLEPGEKHPVLCVIVKHVKPSQVIVKEPKLFYEVLSVAVFPQEITLFNMVEKIRVELKKHVMGDSVFLLGHTYMKEPAKEYFNKSSLKPAIITVTGEETSYRDAAGTFHVPYSEILDILDDIKENETIRFSSGVSESALREDDDMDLSLGMAVWYAHHDTERPKSKKPLTFRDK